VQAPAPCIRPIYSLHLSEPVQFTRIPAKRTGRVPIYPAKFRDKSGEAVNTMQEIFKQLQRITIKVPNTRRCKWRNKRSI
jgi:hypothetical protein